MPVTHTDVAVVAGICQVHRHRVRYGVLAAAISTRAGNQNARPEAYASATVTMLNAALGGRGHVASWVVGANGHPTGYGTPPNELYDVNWAATTPIHNDVHEFLGWLDETVPEWDADLQSTFP